MHANTKGGQSTTMIVIFVLMANALIVWWVEQYHERKVLMSKEQHQAVLAEIQLRNAEVKNEIIILEGVSVWEETLLASSTASN